jgi:hypothetical protein
VHNFELPMVLCKTKRGFSVLVRLMRPCDDATVNAVAPLLLRESTTAPLWSNSRLISKFPSRDAIINGVQPALSRDSTAEPL